MIKCVNYYWPLIFKCIKFKFTRVTSCPKLDKQFQENLLLSDKNNVHVERRNFCWSSTLSAICVTYEFKFIIINLYLYLWVKIWNHMRIFTSSVINKQDFVKQGTLRLCFSRQRLVFLNYFFVFWLNCFWKKKWNHTLSVSDVTFPCNNSCSILE